MEKEEFRVLIEHCYLMGKNTVQAKAWLDKCYPTSAPSSSTVKFWFACFKRGRNSTEDAERSGRPSKATTPENIRKIQLIVSQDQRVKLSEIAEAVGVSKERVNHILRDLLALKKLTARWVPRILTEDQKRIRRNDSERALSLVRCNRLDFLRRFVTVGEIVIHYYLPSNDCSPKSPKKTQPAAGKVMVTIFWDAHGIIFIDYLENAAADYYIALLDRFNDKIKEKRPHIMTKVLFHHDDTAHGKATEKLTELHYELVHHPAHSPDLAPSDYYLFPNIKKFQHGKKFTSRAEVIAKMDGYFADLEQSFFFKGIQVLEDRWTKCVALDGDYIEE